VVEVGVGGSLRTSGGPSAANEGGEDGGGEFEVEEVVVEVAVKSRGLGWHPYVVMS
jgi:hypothetical protein